jgi:cell shape-determining protein MreD
MIMRPGQQLLLPANPLFIWGSLLLALMANMLPLGRTPWLPDIVAVVLVFWSVHQPQRVGIGVAFFFGLCMDVHQTSLLGQHALAYTALSYFAITIHRRLLWFSVPSQAVQVLPVSPFPACTSCWRRCSKPCCGPSSVSFCWRPSAARPTRTKIGPYETLWDRPGVRAPAQSTALSPTD